MNRVSWIDHPEFKLVANGGQWNKFMCISPGVAMIDDYEVYFPVGWETDFTSSPSWARSLVAQLGTHAPAVILHDRLLDMGASRRIARSWMSLQLKELALVSNAKRWRIVSAVWLYDQKLKITQ